MFGRSTREAWQGVRLDAERLEELRGAVRLRHAAAALLLLARRVQRQGELHVFTLEGCAQAGGGGGHQGGDLLVQGALQGADNFSFSGHYAVHRVHKVWYLSS